MFFFFFGGGGGGILRMVLVFGSSKLLRDFTSSVFTSTLLPLLTIIFLTLGLAAGMYSGLTYGLKEARGTHDWVMFLIIFC